LRAPIKTIEVKEPWALIGIYVTGPLKVSPSVNQYVIVPVDYFSKFCITKAITSFSAEITAKFLFEDVVCKFGLPKSIISDNGVTFNSRLNSQLCALCGIEKANSSFFHPPGNGLVERMNKTMMQILTTYAHDSHSNWDAFLQAAVSAYNACVHSSIGFAPYEVLFAR
jgi:transposase InsO family protein